MNTSSMKIYNHDQQIWFLSLQLRQISSLTVQSLNLCHGDETDPDAESGAKHFLCREETPLMRRHEADGRFPLHQFVFTT